ncbi:MAG: permease [Planctomycetes bacterium]|jgi:uncharacterized membrane protein YraQ (UPF0718 family)|nr:permease [Planctomycetota bacterium]
MPPWLQLYGEAAKTAVGFFWKAGWAFVLGYAISAMIQTFVPKARLTKHMGKLGLKTLSLSTIFGTISSSCSFAALATARALLLKGAHFVAAVAFMFASTNLVIELGILILIFLGWQYLVAEIIGGIVLIAISSALIRLTYPETWIDQARRRVEQQAPDEPDDFDPWGRIKSKDGWCMVACTFVDEWKMVWKDIVIGFTIAGFMAVLVPAGFWQALFLADHVDAGGATTVLVTIENAMVAPFVAAATFIGSMGNIPLATVLNAGGVAFAGIMGFIYSDLMVPPLLHINAKYYGWRVALYIAGIMYVSIVATALILNGTFALTGMTPESSRKVEEVAQFKLDYTFWMNCLFVGMGGFLTVVSFVRNRKHAMGGDEKLGLRGWIAAGFALVVAVGVVLHLVRVLG